MQGVSKRSVGQTVKQARARSASTDAQASSSSSSKSNIKAAMLIHRAPLLTPTPSAFDQAYHQYSSSLRLALSNPIPTEFYFKKGSLTERRFSRAQWQREKAVFGEKLAGKQPDVGELPAEDEVKLNVRESEEDVSDVSSESAKKLERKGDGNLYLLVKNKESGKWSLPAGGLQGGEALHEAASRTVATQVGQEMDLWLVTRKPVGLIEEGSGQTFIFKCHILAGAPSPTSSSSFSDYAWLTKEEIRRALGGEEVDAGAAYGLDAETSEKPQSVWRQVEALLS
ncbi:hypothetical protein FFLO_00947 [Filobasidium floriforme]|uniref:Large ribosomal subunit protein mL46 n=1 Tax=Filobasidium floriforme TaxID=5210 RepID=A0A8K0NTB0_9TREE|nr:hypothetical protein FFLO_00947 [Filobasidium floriforme]